MKTPDYWRSKLQEMRQKLETMDEDTADDRKAVELDQSRVGRLSRMDALQGQAMNNAISRRRHLARHRIDAALERLDDGEFGYCLTCGDEIAEKRLELDPSASLCTACSR